VPELPRRRQRHRRPGGTAANDGFSNDGFSNDGGSNDGFSNDGVPNDGFYNDCDSNDCFYNDGVPNDASSIGVPNNRVANNSSGFDDRGSKDGVGRAVHLRFSDQGAGNSVIIHDATIQGRSGGNRCRGHRRGSAGRCQLVGPAQPHRLARWAARLGSSGHVACPWRVWRVWGVACGRRFCGGTAPSQPKVHRLTLGDLRDVPVGAAT